MPKSEPKTLEAMLTDLKRAYEDQCAINGHLRNEIQRLVADAKTRDTDYAYLRRAAKNYKSEMESPVKDHAMIALRREELFRMVF